MPDNLIPQFDRFIRCDPAQRGLIGSESKFGPLCPGHLQAAAEHLAVFGTHVAVVTGFFIPHAEIPAAETDGPPGALFLASALRAAGMETWVITDTHAASAVRAAAGSAGYPPDRILLYPDGDRGWRERFFSTGPGSQLTHLVALERVGPSHTLESLERQSRTGACPRAAFESAVPQPGRNHCHNMRGKMIDEYTADTHCLFEDLPRYRPDARTIGIGDGGNEIGMGQIPWEELERRLTGELSARIPCRIATDWNIIAGTSNWGGYALAAATLCQRGVPHLLRDWDRNRELTILQDLVAHGPAVDGVTGRREPTVDGIPFLTYIQPWEGMRRLMGF